MKYRQVIASMLGVFLLYGLVPVQASERGELSMSAGMALDYFRDDSTAEMEGQEWTFPLGLSYQRGWLALNLSSAYGSIRVTPMGENDPQERRSSKLSHFTDTLLSATYTFAGLSIGAVTIGTDLNLPTGKASLGSQEIHSEVGENHDLAQIDDFGEGWNLGLTLGLIRAVGPLMMGLNGSYIYKGSFDPIDDDEEADFDPGNHVMLTTVVNWKPVDAVTLDTVLVYTSYTPDAMNGESSFQQGDNVTLRGALNYQHTPKLALMLALQDSVNFKNKEWVGGDLRAEPDNSNHKQALSCGLRVSYAYSERLRLQGLTDWRYYAESERRNASAGLPYEGRRVRYAVGTGAGYAFTSQIAVRGQAQYFLLTQDQDFEHEDDVTSQGVNLGLGVTYTY